MTRQICVFSGSSHRELAEEIASRLGLALCPSITRHFQNDNLYVQLQETVRERDVFVVQTFYPPPVSDRVLELFMMLDAARSAGAARVTAVIPYYSYSRSDKKDEPRISITARLIADLLVTAGANRVLTMTLHSPQVHGFFSVPVDHLTSMSVLTNYFRTLDLTDTVIVSPDIGHAKRAAELGRELQLPVAAVSKKRISDTQVMIDGIIGSVSGKRALLLDDEISTGTSMIEAIKELRQLGITEAILACTHGVFAGQAIANLAALDVKLIVTTNTVPVPPEKRLPNMVVLSVALQFAEAIRRIHEGETMQPLFAY